MAVSREEYGKEYLTMKTLRALFWGCVTGAALAYVFAPRRVDLLRSAYGKVSGRSGATTTGSARATNSPATSGRTPPSDGAGDMAPTQTPRASTLDAVNGQTATADNAAYIGNTHTRVYHAAADTNLPSEENRAYFASAADAEAAGYRASGQTTAV
ncbi:MAG TPA: Ada metal-binding domain-containing protein [Ktedonobacterales bacterium]|nr:Ada metal-binding domain-containing protein [Ktedonobacterales bacterium]